MLDAFCDHVSGGRGKTALTKSSISCFSSLE